MSAELFLEHGVLNPEEESFTGQLLDAVYWLKHWRKKKSLSYSFGIRDPVSSYFVCIFEKKTRFLEPLVNSEKDDEHVVVLAEYGLCPETWKFDRYIASVKTVCDSELGTLFLDNLKNRVYFRDVDGIHRRHEEGEDKYIFS